MKLKNQDATAANSVAGFARKNLAASPSFVSNPAESRAAINPVGSSPFRIALSGQGGRGAGAARPPRDGVARGPRVSLKTGFSDSLQVPVTKENRAYLRMLRQREMKAWTSARGAGETEPARATRSLWEQVKQLPAERQAESRVYAILAVLALGTMASVLWQSAELTQNWPGFVRLIQQLLS